MQFVADFHLHSKYSRAVSQNMTLPIMAEYARKKGIDILSACDWTHPLWIKEIQSQLEEAGKGLYKIKDQRSKIKNIDQKSKVEDYHDERGKPMFLLATEIASIYTQNGKLRRIHNLVFVPNFDIAEKINKELIKRGCNLHSDGRPIIGLSSKALLELIMSIDKGTILIPCHVWTPHFGIYGSASGFDSLSEAFGDLSEYIYGIETGLSSDPEMNWQIKELENRSILSFSDAHSPAKMGREVTVFVDQRSKIKDQNQVEINQNDNSKLEITYRDIVSAIKRETSARFKIGYTIEFYPEEGKYHFSGHRNCKIVIGPLEMGKDEPCPVCKKRLTEGVLYRVKQLNNGKEVNLSEQKISSNGIKWYTDKRKKQPPFVKLVPLNEIIAESLGSTVFSQKTKIMFDLLCETFLSEIDVLLKTPVEDIEKLVGPKVAEGIMLVRRGSIIIDPGYDGEYGKVKIFGEDAGKNEQMFKEKQLGFF